MEAGEIGRLGHDLMDLLQAIGHIGVDFTSPFKKDCTDLSRRISLLSHLIDEIRDFKGSSPSSSLADLHLALNAAMGILQIARSSSPVSSDVAQKRISFQFQYVTWQLEKVLGEIPYDHFDVSDEVREQVDLVHLQLRRATEQNGSLNSKALTGISYVLSHIHDDDPDPQILSRVIENLQTENMGDVNHDFQAMLGMVAEIYGKAWNNAGQAKYILERLENFDSSGGNQINEADAKRDNLANKTLEEIKNPDSLTIPDDFCCPISYELMRDPVIVTTGQTYERSSIQRWIDGGSKTCPKTQQKLQNLTLTPNYVLRSLIRQWCEAHRVEQPQGSSNRKSDGSSQEINGDRAAINALVRQLSSQSSAEQRAAVAEIRLLAKRGTENRILIMEAGAIPVLVNLLSTDDLRTQENAVTSILNLSIYDPNKGVIVLAGAIPPIVEVLKKGTMEARENAAATLFSLSLIDENKITIGASGAIKALVDLLQRGSTRGKKDASTALFNLCIYHGNKARAIRAGILVPLMNILQDSSDGMVDETLTILSVLASNQECKVAIAKANAIPVLIDLIRTGLPRNKENATAILLALCKKDSENLACIGRLGALIPLTELAKSGTDRAKRKATSLLEHLGRMQQIV
ncbi:U-box domain-containing protein 11-like [Tasmannia lanceolata]|uniref:U-box domain-containing protein 11-like n=1 Tax=Tasmannia lanceolata TaxID=3420 RepID=UPI0040646DD0